MILETPKRILDDKGEIRIFQLLEKDPTISVRRIFMIKGKKGVVRGKHAHRKCSQTLITISGVWQVKIEGVFMGTENGRQIITENTAEQLLVYHLEPMTWVELMPLTEGAEILVLCDKEYDPADYIHDRKEFEELCRKQIP